MTTAYIYNVETNEIVVIIDGKDEQTVEAKADELGYIGVDEFGLSYTDNTLHNVTSTELIQA